VLHWFYDAKSAFLTVNASVRWLNNVGGMYSVKVFRFLLSAGLGTFLQVSALGQRRRKTPTYSANHINAIQVATQSTLSMHIAQLHFTFQFIFCQSRNGTQKIKIGPHQSMSYPIGPA
jgi:hypothetical protein